MRVAHGRSKRGKRTSCANGAACCMLMTSVQMKQRRDCKCRFDTMEGYRGYFLSHAAFVVRALEPGFDADGNPSAPGEVLGCFYVKPNFPGRCGHVCNGGFITKAKFRKQVCFSDKFCVTMPMLRCLIRAYRHLSLTFTMCAGHRALNGRELLATRTRFGVRIILLQSRL
jgi:hypothetical protein